MRICSLLICIPSFWWKHTKYHIKLHFYKTIYEEELLAVYRHMLLAYINWDHIMEINKSLVIGNHDSHNSCN